MRAKMGNRETNVTAGEILRTYMGEMQKLSAEYEIACADSTPNDYYIYFIENEINKLETLINFYMDHIASLKGDRR